LAGPLGIKLRCASWQQLATIYRRDLSRGTMFLKASSQPPLGTPVRIDLELPSATVIELAGTISQHVVDPQRGTGVELALEPLPTKTVWLIESALSAETAVRAQTASGAPADTSEATPSGDVAEAEDQLIGALEAEAESLKRLNPFLVLGVGYEASDADVRGAFGELTKRYHPDRFARYQSTRLRQLAAEIFILIRDAYRKLSDDASRAQVRQQLGVKPARAKTPPPIPRQTGAVPVVRVPNAPNPKSDPPSPPPQPLRESGNAIPEPPRPTQYDAPTNPSDKSAAIASTQLARPEDNINAGVPSAHVVDRKSGPVRRTQPATAIMPSQQVPIASGDDGASYDTLVDQGKLDEALAGYRAAAKRNANDRAARAGIELVEGLRALTARDRLEAAQRFEAALEIDPSNERAARELADMRRQATNERKGLLSRLMGKKEGPT
jgi:tetratricopeptide (TPR) repeat protein